MSDKSAKKITALIADDEELARLGIRALLSQADDIEVVGEAKDGLEVQKLIPELYPDILLLDYKMPGPGAYTLEKWIRDSHPQTRTLVLTAHDHDAYLAKMINSGISEYVLKNENASQLIEAIHRAVSGTAYFTNEQIARAQKWKMDIEEKWACLSLREKEVLKRLAAGEHNKAIAISLTISLKTVEFHITNILKKLGVDSRDEAIVWMLKHQPDDPWAAKD